MGTLVLGGSKFAKPGLKTKIRVRYALCLTVRLPMGASKMPFATEVAAAFPAPWTVDEDIVRRDYPDPLSETALALWDTAARRAPPDDATQRIGYV
jgi:hypothetical protein